MGLACLGFFLLVFNAALSDPGRTDIAIPVCAGALVAELLLSRLRTGQARRNVEISTDPVGFRAISQPRAPVQLCGI